MKTFLTRSRLPSKSLPTPAPGRGPGCVFASSHGTPAWHRRPALLSPSSPVNRSPPGPPRQPPNPPKGLAEKCPWAPRVRARVGGEPGRRKDGAFPSRGELRGEQQERSGCSRSLQQDFGWSSPPGTPIFWPLDPKASTPEVPGAGWSPGRVSPEAGRAADPSTHLLSVSSSNTGAPPAPPPGREIASTLLHMASRLKPAFFPA